MREQKEDAGNSDVLGEINFRTVDLSKIVRLSDWVDAFAWHKWNAYVFSQADILPIVSIAAKIVFERHNIHFDNDTVFSGIRDSSKIEKLVQWLRSNNKYPDAVYSTLES